MTTYCFLTTSSEGLILLYIFTFSYSMLSAIDELQLPYNFNVCSFHWILLNIRVDKGIVEVMDPLKRNWKSSATCRTCSRGNFRAISVSFVDFM